MEGVNIFLRIRTFVEVVQLGVFQEIVGSCRDLNYFLLGEGSNLFQDFL